MASPGPIGSVTPSTGAFSTISASGLITSTAAADDNNPALLFSGGNGFNAGSSIPGVVYNQGGALRWGVDYLGVMHVGNLGGLQWNSVTSSPASGGDTFLTIDGAGIMALKSGTSATQDHSFRLYALNTDASNYHYGSVAMSDTALTISTVTAGTGVDDLGITLTPSGTGVISLGGPVTCSKITQSGAQITTSTNGGAVATSGTITTTGTGYVRTAPAGAVTGVIMQAGIADGQRVTISNSSAAASTITMAAAGTSNVADGVGTVIAGLTAQSFVWDATAARWFHEK